MYINNNYSINRVKRFFTLILGAIIFCFASSCTGGDLSVYLLGSEVGFYIVEDGFTEGSKTYRQIKSQLKNLADSFNDIFSVEDLNSEVSTYNHLLPNSLMEVSGDFYFVANKAYELYQNTDGAVNPQIKQLVDLWGFSKPYKEVNYTPKYPYDREYTDGYLPLPSKSYVTAFSSLTDYSLTTFQNEDGFYIKKPNLQAEVDGVTYYAQLDLAGFVKGYYCDKAKEVFDKYNIKKYYLSAGGSSLYLGENSGKKWTLSIKDPFNKWNNLLSVELENVFVSTSGTYQNCYQIDGVTYSHIINGKTGYPADSNLVSATVICESGIISDGLSTALINMGLEASVKYLNDNDFSYVLITDSGEVFSDLEINYLN